jgi:enoyl-CoA hydratase/carnithine racemase
MTSTVLSEQTNGVRTLTLNRPERLNAISVDLVEDLCAALSEALADKSSRVIVLRGSGRAFCSGDDLKDFGNQARSRPAARKFLNKLQDVSRLIVLGEKVVIGAVHGWAVGGGFEWLVNCDIVFMAEGTRCFFPETQFGMVVTGGVTALLPRIVGEQCARALMLSGERIDAARAHALGLAWRVLPEERLFLEVKSFAERLSEMPVRGLADTKRLSRRIDREAFEAALKSEADAVLEAFLDPGTAPRMVKTKE